MARGVDQHRPMHLSAGGDRTDPMRRILDGPRTRRTLSTAPFHQSAGRCSARPNAGTIWSCSRALKGEHAPRKGEERSPHAACPHIDREEQVLLPRRHNYLATADFVWRRGMRGADRAKPAFVQGRGRQVVKAHDSDAEHSRRLGRLLPSASAPSNRGSVCRGENRVRSGHIMQRETLLKGSGYLTAPAVRPLTM